MFDLAFEKLPDIKQEQYEKMHHKKSLRKFILFLRDHIITLQALLIKPRSTTIVTGNPNFITPISFDRRPLCFRCFRYNHVLKQCRGEPLLSLAWIKFDDSNDDEEDVINGGGGVCEKKKVLLMKGDENDFLFWFWLLLMILAKFIIFCFQNIFTVFIF